NFVSMLSIYTYALHAGVPYQGTMINENRALLPSYFKGVAYNNNATRMNLSGVHAKSQNLDTEIPYTIHDALLDSNRYLKSLQNNTFLAKGIKENYENRYQLVLHQFEYLLKNAYRAVLQASMVLQKEDTYSDKKAQRAFMK